MKKSGKISTFLSGMLAMAMVMALTGAALAKSGAVTFNQAGITLFGEVKVQKGQDFQAPNGQSVPSVITYEDEAGGKTNYLSVRQLSELLDADIAWNSETGNVDIAPHGKSNIVVTSWDNDDVPELPAVPEYGTVAGPFKEIDPATVDTNGRYESAFENERFTSSHYGLTFKIPVAEESGRYIVIDVTNNGEEDRAVRVWRPITIGARYEPFTEVKVAPGQTLRRAFYLEDGASSLESKLVLDVARSFGRTGPTDITLSVRMYK